MSHFCGYEGRAGLPTNFDATYAYALGYSAAVLAAGGAHSCVACVINPTAPPRRWEVAGVPLCRLMRAERRAGKDRLVIRKVMVDVDGPGFAHFAAQRDSWRKLDHYSCPGPMQFDWSLDDVDDVEGGGANHLPMVLRLASGDRGGSARDALRCTRAGSQDAKNMEAVEKGECIGAWAA